jgi:very-short-patch-repair endonuclease
LSAAIAGYGSLDFLDRPSEPLTAMEESPDRAIARFAARHRTLVGWDQLLAFGLGPDAIAYRNRTGRLTLVFHRVYSVVSGELPPLGREQAALLRCGRHAFLSHRTAAFVLGLVKTPPPSVEVSVVGRHCKPCEGLKIHRIQAIDRWEVKRHDGLWVSTPARAVLELAATATADELTRAIDEGLAQRRFTPHELRAVLARNRPCRGAARLDAILGDETSTSVSRSRTEKRLLKLLRDARLPLPETNFPFGGFELDFFWRRERLAVEVDGYPFHRGPRAFRRDREKELALRDADIDLLRFVSDHVHEQPMMVLAKIAGELGRRGVAD